ncbi:hypothetical protein HJC23_010019 [Cyclotella cryptica]|uniref:Separase n=1 Tax=Cyclotella cryptica TaxID=29204 RepID=A0ABD3PX50_9STRA
MWAAANSGASRNHIQNPDHESDSSEWDSDSSDERSTTESIHGEASGKPAEKNDEEFRGVKRSLQHKRRPRRRRKKRKREETPEATMARLTTSYSAAMEAVGALHRVSKQICKETADNATYDSKEQNDDQHMTCDPQVKGDSPEKQLEKSRMTIQKVAQSARTTLEQSLLLDPIILAPIFLPPRDISRTVKENNGGRMTQVTNNKSENNTPADLMASAFLTAWNQADTALDTIELYRQLSLAKWKKLSAAHKSTAKQIAYLSLVNYADLLLCGCTCSDSCSSDILDRKPVQSLKALELFPDNCNDVQNANRHCTHHTCCLWVNESRDQTLRLALSSYCDASELDPTDPTLWFKVACTARSLGRQVDPCHVSSNKASEDSSIVWKPKSYRSLERLALERGLSALPKGVPPNRMLSKAWREMEKWEQSQHSQIVVDEGESVMDTDESGGRNRPLELVIHLPKYSWSTLGRILIRACNEGAGYGRSSPAVSHVWSTNCCLPEDYEFGSPLIDIRISPLLCLSHYTLRLICEYLGNASKDVKNLARTCKSLPSDILTAHTKIYDRGNIDAKVLSIVDGDHRSENIEQPTSAPVVEQEKPDTFTNHHTENISEGTRENLDVGRNTDGQCSSATISKQPKPNTYPPRAGRASKRVRSLMLTSEKESERQAKRSSVEYCFLAGTLSCTAQNPLYSRILETEFHWEQLPVLKSCLKSLEEFSGSNTKNDRNGEKRIDTAVRGTSYSLSNFISNVTKKNSGPRHLLELFLVHVALNTADVFESSRGDLTNCYLDCFDLLTSRCEESVEAGCNPMWYRKETNDFVDTNTDFSLEILAVNLLTAELRLKRAEYQGTEHDLRNDAALLASLVPALLQFAVSISPIHGVSKNKCRFNELECRCYWLASGYYFWLGHCSSDPLASADGERLGMEYINKALKCLFIDQSINKKSDIHIKTPQLHSSIREGHHWSVLSYKTLSAYHEHLQSSSIVSRARDEFIAYHQSAQSNLSADHAAKLTSVGKELLDWYWKGSETSQGSFVEMVNDFIFHHQDLLERMRPPPGPTTSSCDWQGELYWGQALWNSVTSSKAASIERVSMTEVPRLSIIQVLSYSLFACDEHVSSVFVIFAQLTLTALHMSGRLLIDRLKGETANNDREAEAVSQTSRQYEQLSVANYFMDKMIHCLSTADLNLTHVDCGEKLCAIIHESLRMSFDIHYHLSLTHFNLILSLSRLVLALKSRDVMLKETVEHIESVYFVILAKVFVNLRRDFAIESSDKDRRKKARQTQTTRKADFVSHVANELAECLSVQLSKITSDRSLSVSPLVKALIGCDTLPLVQLSEAVLWFWKHVNNIADKTDSVRVRILRPIAAAIVSLCGSFSAIADSVRLKEPVSEDDCDKSDSLSYYFESDDSTNGAFLEEEYDASNEKCKMLLKKLNQVVQCISLVYSVAEKAPCQENAPFISPSHRHGAFLPLVVVRTLSNLADNIFRLFSQDVWCEEYPYGARSSGVSLDSILASAYRYVYGFSLSGQNQNSPESSIDDSHLPESLEAAAQLFRCIRRLYHSNRRSIPLRPLEHIEKILPPKQPTPVSYAIREFLFNGSTHTASNQDNEDLPLGFPEWILDKCYDDELRAQSETDRLRKMVSSELAKGSITNLDSKQVSSCDEDGGSLSGERELTRGHELSLYNKFRAVLDDLSNNPSNVEGWVVLSESCGFKADIICDRLVSKNESFKYEDFRPMPSSMRTSPATMTLDQLKKAQLDEFEESLTSWLPFLGNDLYVYMKYPWSSISSLQACAKDIGSKLADGNVRYYSRWKEIQLKFEKGDYVTWAQDWAGMFVFALRTMKIRALYVARYLAKTRQDNIVMHPSEVCEDIGTALYGDLIGGTSYGYPITAMTSYEKREIAQRAKSLFDETIELSLHGNYARKSESVLWENQFMIGKSLEKIASTLSEEAFNKGAPGEIRYYETLLTHALQTYSSALANARFREQSIGGHGKSETGGSSHGSVEVFYRIHACRFKTLLSSIRRVHEERELAEREALRITNAAWFGDSSNFQTSSDLRTETWDAFSNCVKALMQCRSDEPRFHRAVFRLSQALNWAPLFENPNYLLLGHGESNAQIAGKKCIPGFDTGSFVQNAALVIGSLFDKRRQVSLSQLCAVWVTTSTTPPPFEVLNDSVRKYDSLRLKYIKAFIDCMLVCREKDKIESLFNHSMSCAQDLPGFYQASAAVRGGDPGRHNKQPLLQAHGFLAEVKRTASDALAQLILYDLVDLKQRGVNEDGKMLLDSDFKLANILFLRLNSHPNEIVHHMCSNGPIIQATALCKCHISIQAGYRISESINFEELDSDTLLSFIEQALLMAKEMFPTKSKQQTLKK